MALINSQGTTPSVSLLLFEVPASLHNSDAFILNNIGPPIAVVSSPLTDSDVVWSNGTIPARESTTHTVFGPANCSYIFAYVSSGQPGGILPMIQIDRGDSFLSSSFRLFRSPETAEKSSPSSPLVIIPLGSTNSVVSSAATIDVHVLISLVVRTVNSIASLPSRSLSRLWTASPANPVPINCTSRILLLLSPSSDKQCRAMATSWPFPPTPKSTRVARWTFPGTRLCSLGSINRF
mmetsp:Transcript_18605/g.46160  ORF Transcript_18605/g.46160 Transcript_18605/m.46160 type:complete len:236 (+) Transcript_18605:608-1315(+)